MRVTEAAIEHPATPTFAKTANVFAKGALVLLLLLALLYPDQGNLRDKAAGMRAVGYPLISFTLPVLWWTLWRERMSFPWLSDLLITITCFTDILGNRMDLYDTVVWFDDLMHFMNTGLLAAAFILLTLPRDVGFGRSSSARSPSARRRPSPGSSRSSSPSSAGRPSASSRTPTRWATSRWAPRAPSWRPSSSTGRGTTGPTCSTPAPRCPASAFARSDAHRAAQLG